VSDYNYAGARCPRSAVSLSAESRQHRTRWHDGTKLPVL
jgi:hypothetical protein